MLKMVIKSMAIVNTEGWFYNGSMFTVGTSREIVCSDCAMRASCNGLCSIGWTSTSRSIGDTQLLNLCRGLRLLVRPCWPLPLLSWAFGSPYDTSDRKSHRCGIFTKFLSAFTEPLQRSIVPLHSISQLSKADFSTFYPAFVPLFYVCSAFDAVGVTSYTTLHPLRLKLFSLGIIWQGGRGTYIKYAGKEGFHTTSKTFLGR